MYTATVLQEFQNPHGLAYFRARTFWAAPGCPERDPTWR
jgi:hypothetical protein